MKGRFLFVCAVFIVNTYAQDLLREPVSVYNDWSSYDELSDNIPLTEKLAMKEFGELLRLRRHGARFDYYMMDAFWFAKEGGYRTWRKPEWPDGPDAWLKRCRETGVRPGLWFGTNQLVKLDPIHEWQSSLNAKKTAMCFYEGGFLSNFIDTLKYWYGRGIRMFEFDFADFDAAPPGTEKTSSPEQIRARNEAAFRDALKRFRAKNPDIVLVAFNGFGGDMDTTSAPFPFRHPIDLRWLDVFDTIYCGDPRPSDVPTMNFWRSLDIYSDHMIRRYAQSGVPLERIDATNFMLGTTGTIFYRRAHAWKGMFLLMLSHGGWIETTHGNLELLDEAQAQWYAKVQRLYLGMLALGRTKTFGGIPGNAEPYGFASINEDGGLYTVVNPAQAISKIELPRLSQEQLPPSNPRLLFRDAGFQPILTGNTITLGPEQMALVGFGKYANPEYDLGIQEDVLIPNSIEPVSVSFTGPEKNVIQAIVPPWRHGNLRIVMQQFGKDGYAERSWGGGPPNGVTMAKILSLTARQAGKAIPIEINYDIAIWSGFSWAVGEIKASSLSPNESVEIRCSTAEKQDVRLQGRLFHVEYVQNHPHSDF